MKRTKKFFALLGVVVIVALYLVTLILAFSKSPDMEKWLAAALFSTFAVPIFLYIVLWLQKLLNKNDEE